MTNHPEPSLKIRPATISDGAALTILYAHLGYPTTQESIQRRLDILLLQTNHALYVAEWNVTDAVGVIHLSRSISLATDPYIEIGGLVVHEHYRGFGIGTRLMEYAEQWARVHGCTSIRFRSRGDRAAAHAFYAKLGYQVTKTQFAFQKTLDEPHQS